MHRLMRLSLLVALALALPLSLACASPVIQDVYVERGLDIDAPDWVTYHQQVTVTVADADGAADITSVTITDPSTADHTVTPSGGGDWSVLDATTIECTWAEWRLLAAPAADAYSVTAVDAGANEDSLTTAAAPALPSTPTEATSPAMESVITSTTPTFQWTAAPAGFTYVLHLEEEGTWGEIWAVDMGAATQALYDFDANATKPALEANHAYFWRLECARADDDGVTDPRVRLWTVQDVTARFTVYGAWADTPPDLPGKFAYEICLWGDNGISPPDWGMDAIAAYNTDPNLRSWLAYDNSSYPDWSPDGNLLLYSRPDGIWIDPLDGASPTQVPGVDGGDCRWASDSGRVVYTVTGPDSPFVWPNFDVWVAHIDGSTAYPIANSIEHHERWPEWSPDGMWIAYRKMPDAIGTSLWMVRYDGTDDHPIIATEVVGYPGYSVGYMGEHAWSPNGLQLAVNFGAGDGVNEIGGIGILSRDGGPLTPVFVAPSTHICCSGVHLPQWSPDGAQVVFSSAHHVPDPAPYAVFEPRVELWLANADGSGTPVRLTYDQGFSYYVAWWAENTETGEAVPVIKGDTTVVFDEVTESGNTSITIYEEPIGLPVSYQFCEDFYEISTTAEIVGPITICMAYRDEDVPSGTTEAELAILHYIEAGDYWEDITVSRDPDNNLVCGESASLSVFVLAAGPPPSWFPDVPPTGFGPGGTDPHWAFNHIEACVEANIVKGYPDGYYRPDLTVDRASMAVYISRALADGDDSLPDGPTEPTFLDVLTDDWAYKWVEYAHDANIVEGYPDGNYRPTWRLTRGQMAVFVARALADPIGEEGLADYLLPETPSFTDVPADHWAYLYIENIAEQGVTSGYPDGNYRPAWQISRDQMAVYITRAFDLPI